VEYADLGMEAVWKIEVENFPAFIIIDKGNDFFAMKEGKNFTAGHPASYIPHRTADISQLPTDGPAPGC